MRVVGGEVRGVSVVCALRVRRISTEESRKSFR